VVTLSFQIGEWKAARITLVGSQPKLQNELRVSAFESDRCPKTAEATVSVIAPAICDAIFSAPGKRLRRPPIRNEDLA
jgi:hypothetical protein